MCKHVWSQKLSERSRKKGGRTWPERCLERTTKGGEKERMLDVGPCLVPCSIYKHPLYLTAQFSLLPHPAYVLKDTSSLQICDLPTVPPTSCTNILAGFAQPLCQSQDLHLLY